MAVMGAQILFYPTAIGSEPADPAYDSKDHWQMCMRGHSAVNIMPVVASNRVGTETFDQSEITFYGSSFITDNKGRILKEMDRKGEGVIVEEIDLEAYQKERDAWGLFRDRRPAQYGPLMTLDGRVKS
jgi:N-carbamoylputrescine amidase